MKKSCFLLLWLTIVSGLSAALPRHAEKLSEAEWKKRAVPVEGYPGTKKAYAANMSYIVLMDGTVISPKKKAN